MADTEQARRQNNTAKLLAYLQEHKQATNAELMHKGVCGWRAAARILDLRKQGYVIETIRIKNGLFKYVYHGKRDADGQISLFEEGI